MAKIEILIACLDQRQSYYTALEIASCLSSRGNTVSFVGIENGTLRAHIEKQGYEFFEVKDSPVECDSKRQSSSSICPIGLSRWRNLHICAQGIETLIGGVRDRFHLLMIDTTISGSFAATIISKYKIPAIKFCSGYTSKFNLNYPPTLYCSELPQASSFKSYHPATIRYLWAKTIISFHVHSVIAYPHTLVDFVFDWKSRMLARKYGAKFCFGDWGVHLDIPEISVADENADWPELRSLSDRFYLNRSRTSQSEFSAVDWARDLDVAKPLVYCSMGGLIDGRLWKNYQKGKLTRWGKQLQNYLAVVLAAAKQSPEWNYVIAAGHLDETVPPEMIPSNVRLLRWVPQDEVLRRTSVMITAGGSATVRDCLFFGIPMVVIPLWADHFGNSARIEYFKFGRRIMNFKKLKPETLVSFVRQVKNDSEIARAFANLKEKEHTNKNKGKDLEEFIHRHTGISF